MRKPAFDPSAKKRTVGLTLNADLYVKAKVEGIDAKRGPAKSVACSVEWLPLLAGYRLPMTALTLPNTVGEGLSRCAGGKSTLPPVSPLPA